MTVPARITSAMACLIGVTLSLGCSDDGGDSGTAPPADDMPVSTLDEAALERLDGVWERRGYGDLYVFADDRTTWHTLTENTCLEITSFEGVAGIAPAELEQARYELQGERLSLLLPGEAFVSRFRRRDELPARCDEPVAGDARGVFDHLWTTFDEHYAFFGLRGVDWSAEYARQTPRIGDALDDAALFALLSDLLSPIDDGHVFLTSGSEVYSPAVEDGALRELRRGFEGQDDVTDFGVWIDGVLERFRQAIVSRLDAGSERRRGSLWWATANGGGTGYLFVEAMTGYVVDANGERRDGASAAEELAAATRAMDEAMADLADTGHMIVDVRLNGGGHDAIGFELARRFVGERQLAFSKSARSRGVESIPVEAWLEPPGGGAYLNPLTLIVGADTRGAAETFAIPLRRLPQVTVIGETSAGTLSEVLVKPLPNGWVAGLSNEVYLDAEGVGFEGVGVVPDIELPVFRLEDIEAGRDPALDRALSPR